MYFPFAIGDVVFVDDTVANEQWVGYCRGYTDDGDVLVERHYFMSNSSVVSYAAFPYAVNPAFCS